MSARRAAVRRRSVLVAAWPEAAAGVRRRPAVADPLQPRVWRLSTELVALRRSGRAGRQNAAAVLEPISQTEGPVYSTDMVLLYRAGKALAAEPAIISVLAEHGQWDDTPFVNRIESGYFGLIVSSRFPLTERLMFSPAVQAAIERAYEPRERIGAYTLYRPGLLRRSYHDSGERVRPASRIEVRTQLTNHGPPVAVGWFGEDIACVEGSLAERRRPVRTRPGRLSRTPPPRTPAHPCRRPRAPRRAPGRSRLRAAPPGPGRRRRSGQRSPRRADARRRRNQSSRSRRPPRGRTSRRSSTRRARQAGCRPALR